MTPAQQAVIDAAKKWVKAEDALTSDHEYTRAIIRYDEACNALRDAARKLAEVEA